MDDDRHLQQQGLDHSDGDHTVVANKSSWLGSLQLNFENRACRSFLAYRKHVGPFVIQKTLHPEGASVCHGIVVHPPGGVAGGDQLQLTVDVASNANALLTTPGAGKWYKANAKQAKQTLRFNVAEGSCFEWLPQENILFDGADVHWIAEIDLADNATFVGWDIVCLGRQAQQENWQTGALKQQFKVRRNGQLCWIEQANLSAYDLVKASIVGLGDQPVFGNFIVVASHLPDAVLEACREINPSSADPQAVVGISALPEVVIARYIGESSESAKAYFEALWIILRPWYLNKTAVRPRIWNT